MSNCEHNKQVVRAAFGAMSTHFANLTRGDASEVLRHFRDDAVWVNRGTSDPVATKVGLEAIAKMICGFGDVVDPPFEWNIHSVTAEGDTVVFEADGLCTTKSGRPYHNKYCFVVRLIDGRIANINEYMSNEAVAAAFA
jgi:ketosteroid isomerase-like protein